MDAQAEAAKSQRCCAIICAYDEAGRIGRVVHVACQSNLFSEVVVVDDGSHDATAAEAEAAGARVVKHARNRGKSAALQTGLDATQSHVVCFLDADLLHLTPAHLEQLCQPVLQGVADATLGVFSGGRLATTLAQKISPMISGQRCLKRELLDGFTGWDSGFGIEVAINDYLLHGGIEQRIVELHGAAQVMKEEKRGLLQGLAARLKMYGQILKVWIAHRLRRN